MRKTIAQPIELALQLLLVGRLQTELMPGPYSQQAFHDEKCTIKVKAHRGAGHTTAAARLSVLFPHMRFLHILGTEEAGNRFDELYWQQLCPESLADQVTIVSLPDSGDINWDEVIEAFRGLTVDAVVFHTNHEHVADNIVKLREVTIDCLHCSHYGAIFIEIG